MVDLNNIKLPFVVKDVTLFVPGTHNGINFARDSIETAYHTTNWADKRVISLYRDHNDDWAIDPTRPWMGKNKQRGANVADYLGSVRNVKLQNGKIIGDLYVVDRDTATKLSYDDCQFAISPSGHWKGSGRQAKEFVIRNFAMVVNPAQKQAYINVSTLLSTLNKNQIGIHYFAMSQDPQTKQNNKNNMEETNMDVDELKQEIKESVSGAMKPLNDKITSLEGNIDEIRKKKEEEDKQKETLAAKEEEEAKKKKEEEMSNTIKELQEKVKAYEEDKEKKKDKPVEGEDKLPEDEDEPEPRKTITTPSNEPPKEMSRSQAQREFADFLTTIGSGV
jgi:hypothetical protein